MSKPSRCTRGFTILEMLVVLGIILVLSGMGTAAITSMQGGIGDPLHSAAEQVRATLFYARSLAAKTGINHSVTFNNYDTSAVGSSMPANWNAWGNNVLAFHGTDPLGTDKITNPISPAFIFDPEHQWYAIVKEDPLLDINGNGDPTDDIYSDPVLFDSALVGGKRYLPDGIAFSGLLFRDGRVKEYNQSCYFAFDTTRADNIPTPKWSMLSSGEAGTIRYQFDDQRWASFYRPDYTGGLPGVGEEIYSVLGDGQLDAAGLSSSHKAFAKKYGRKIDGMVVTGWDGNDNPQLSDPGAGNAFWPATEARYAGINYHPICWGPGVGLYQVGYHDSMTQDPNGMYEYQAIGLFEPGETLEGQPFMYGIEVNGCGGMIRVFKVDIEAAQANFSLEHIN